MQLVSALGGLLTETDFNFGPLLFPAVAAQDIAQRQHGIDVGVSPMHTRTFQARFDHQFIPAFDHATANGPTLGLKLGILHLVFALFQISQIARDDFFVRMLLLKIAQFRQ